MIEDKNTPFSTEIKFMVTCYGGSKCQSMHKTTDNFSHYVQQRAAWAVREITLKSHLLPLLT